MGSSGNAPGQLSRPNGIATVDDKYVFVVERDNHRVQMFALPDFQPLLAFAETDLSLLDAKVEQLCAKILLTFPDCTTKTLEELRKPKLEAWNRNKEDARAWLQQRMAGKRVKRPVARKQAR